MSSVEHFTLRLEQTPWSNLVSVLTDWNSSPSFGVDVRAIFMDMDALLHHMLDNFHGFTFKSTNGIKALSHYGAICCNGNASPDWLKCATYENGVHMVDPGNHIYAVTMCILMRVGLLPKTTHCINVCNNEKLGDYVEAILGVPCVVNGAWDDRLQKIITAINKMVAAIAQFDVPFKVSCSKGFVPRLSPNTILKHLGAPLDEVLAFYDRCNMERGSVTNVFSSPQPSTQKSDSSRASSPPHPPPPPIDWVQVWSEEHEHFYYWNARTGTTTWDVPSVPFRKAARDKRTQHREVPYKMT